MHLPHKANTVVRPKSIQQNTTPQKKTSRFKCWASKIYSEIKAAFHSKKNVSRDSNHSFVSACSSQRHQTVSRDDSSFLTYNKKCKEWLGILPKNTFSQQKVADISILSQKKTYSAVKQIPTIIIPQKSFDSECSTIDTPRVKFSPDTINYEISQAIKRNNINELTSLRENLPELSESQSLKISTAVVNHYQFGFYS